MKNTLKASVLSLFTLNLLISSNMAMAHIKFKNGVKKSQEKIMENDLKYLSSKKTSPADPETLRLMDIPNFYNESLEKWLYDRVSYVIGPISLWKIITKLETEESYYVYENAGILPDYEEPKKLPPSDKPKKDEEEEEGFVVMANFGSAIYMTGKKDSRLYRMQMGGFGPWGGKKVSVKSPRSGIIMVGEGLFHEKLMINKANEEAESNKLSRLATFFHEARHSDGNSKSLGFAHALCPEGSRFYNFNACDRNLNGPYTIGARVMAEFIKDCETCSEEEVQKLQARVLDSYSRVIEETPVYQTGLNINNSPRMILGLTQKFYQARLAKKPILSSNSENRIEKIEDKLSVVEPLIQSLDEGVIRPIEQPVKFIKSTEWDATPEGI